MLGGPTAGAACAAARLGGSQLQLRTRLPAPPLPCSFGVVLWEICTGLLPARGRMRPLITPDDCPPQIAALVDDCMSPDPTQRPSAPQLVERLSQAPASPPAATFLTAPQHQASRFGTRSESGVQGAAAARPPRPRSESSLPVAGDALTLLPPVHEEAQHTAPAATTPAASSQQPQRVGSLLTSAPSAASDTAVLNAPVPAGAVAPAMLAGQQMARGFSLPVRQTTDQQHPGDVYGLGLF